MWLQSARFACGREEEACQRRDLLFILVSGAGVQCSVLRN